MQNVSCFSISSNDQLDLVYLTLNSIKHTKQPNTIIQYYLLLDCNEQKNLQYCVTYFKDLATETFNIIVYNISSFMQYIDPILGKPYTNLKCFAPKIFNEDKILAIDTDMIFVKEGIEQLWNTNIDDKYAAVVQEPLVTYFEKAKFELNNTHTKSYFNAGLILFNLKKIREDGLDIEMVGMINKWDLNKLKPLACEQTLLNYLFKDNVVFLDFKFNNPLIVLTPPVGNAYQQFLKQKQNGDTIEESIQKAVNIHFLGQNKPWKQKVRQLFDVEKDFPFKNECIKLWDQIVQKYKKKEEF